MLESFDHGKVAIVTGAGCGIGRAIAECHSADGASVVVSHARSQDDAQAPVDAILAAGGQAAAVRASMGSLQQVRRRGRPQDVHRGVGQGAQTARHHRQHRPAGADRSGQR